MKTSKNLTPNILGYTVQHCECPNEDLSEQYGTIEGTYVEDGRLMVVVLFSTDRGNKLQLCCADYLRVEGPK